MTQQPITIATYNIHKGMSAFNRQMQVQQIASALDTLSPDLLFLQEVQGANLKRAQKFNYFPELSQYDYFAREMGLNASYGLNAHYHQHKHHGNALLSRYKIKEKTNLNITLHKHEQRGVLHCEVLPQGWDRPIVALCAHFNLRQKDRAVQYAVLSDYIKHKVDPQLPLILAGDFNDWRHQACDQLVPLLDLEEAFMTKHGAYPKSFPARAPMLSLDRIYLRNLKIVDAQVHKGLPWQRLSDHLPLSATVLPA